MLDHELGTISEVRLRDIWPHEAGDFTPWLARDLRSLGNSLGLDLELVEEEARSGTFSLDILAKSTVDDEKVAIENQLERTNHSHLGQLLTYAAEHEVGYVVWIASKFRPEHRAAIEWLNGLAPDKVWFYAVEVHAIKIGDSLPALDFRPVAVPKKWNGSVTPSPIEAPSSTVVRLREFFKPLVTELEQADFGQAEADQADSQYWFPHSHPDVWYVAGLDDDGAWVCLWLFGNVEITQRLYNALQLHQMELDAGIGSELIWGEYGPTNGSNITWILDENASIDDPPEKLDETRAWMLETLPKFRDVFNPRLERILAELETE